jgi:hypothetical protein
MKKKLLSLTLCGTMFLYGCSTSWLTTVSSILAAAAPALINILQIAALAEGKPMDSGLAAKVNGDAANLKKVLSDYQVASTAAQPGMCSQVQATLNVYEEDLPAVLAVAQVSNQNVQSKIAAISALTVRLFASSEPLIPGCQAPPSPKAMMATLHPASVDLKTFIPAYNAALTSPTGHPAVDKATPGMKLHEHSKAVRMLTLGIAK